MIIISFEITKKYRVSILTKSRKLFTVFSCNFSVTFFRAGRQWVYDRYIGLSLAPPPLVSFRLSRWQLNHIFSTFRVIFFLKFFSVATSQCFRCFSAIVFIVLYRREENRYTYLYIFLPFFRHTGSLLCSIVSYVIVIFLS